VRENNSHIDCGCPREKKIPVLELEFIKAQRQKAKEVFRILSESTEGVCLCDQLLPTISEMSSGELNFAVAIRSLLQSIVR
ncbi:hypothetical protein Hamer_G029697, partial [Homarus americanus]